MTAGALRRRSVVWPMDLAASSLVFDGRSSMSSTWRRRSRHRPGRSWRSCSSPAEFRACRSTSV